MSALQHRLITAEEFARMPDPEPECKEELVRGVIVRSPLPDFRHGCVNATAGCLIGNHIKENDLGHATIGSGVITERNPDTVLGPDVAFWSYQRLPVIRDEWPEVLPDLVVEIVSAWETHESVIEKGIYYATRGVPVVWVINPKRRTVSVCRSNERVLVSGESDELLGDSVLPGLRLSVSEFFTQLNRIDRSDR